MTLQPKDRAEEIALFRLEIIGQLARRELLRGELRAELEALSEQRFRPPGADSTRTYAASTLERWYYAYQKGGLDGLKPSKRSDCGFARHLSDELRELLLDIRREYPSASVPLVLRTLIADGRLERGVVSAATVRRLYRAYGLDRATLKASQDLGRRKWQAPAPNDLWHGDVKHFESIRIHGLLDDTSRFVVALEARDHEREDDMLDVLGLTLSRLGAPKMLYLDNGSTYRGKALQTVCGRLNIALVHARPYDPQARGKMERFWRTLEADVLLYLKGATDLHTINVRLQAWLDGYHKRPHGGLMGKSPVQIYRKQPGLDLAELQKAFTKRSRRKVNRDSTLSFDGQLWETVQSHLAGKIVTVCQPMLPAGRRDPRPWIEVEGREHRLEPVDAVANGRKKRRRNENKPAAEGQTHFSPADAQLKAILEGKR